MQTALKIIAFAVILIFGWFIVSLVEKGVAALLRTEKFKDLVTCSGFGNFVGKMGVKTDSAGFVALIVLVAALNALGLPASDAFHQQLSWLPTLAVALVVLVIGGLTARAMSRLVRGATSRAELGNPDLLATISGGAVWAFAIFIAINQIELTITLVNTLFMATVGAAALTLLAYGVSRRETAAEIVRGWQEKGKQVIPKIKEAAQHVRKQAQQTRQPTQPRR